MSTASDTAPAGGSGRRLGRGTDSAAIKRFAPLAVLVVVVVLMFTVGTSYVGGGSNAAVAANGGTPVFDPTTFATKNFPVVQSYISSKAVPATTLAAGLKTDPTGAKFGKTPDGAAGPEIPVKFTGVVGKNQGNGTYAVTISGLPKTHAVNLVVGPAITSTDLRDVSGAYTQNTPGIANQTDFLNASLALNNQLKSQVLAKLGTSSLTGKTVEVEGAFLLINPNLWTVTPSKVAVK
ncbi:DUF2291 family protein [Allobranchiibius sp. CTAmp26]|uniref:DUF2291 family protein n=1 Tax=Allobranchiibius sp. CTAmp26 TaxID=2815214 RepID=UPI001AA1BB51|nr:DUF2291 family protein [Allobranchiibius sp. CTAmp26]MBO1756794.1 DUF2291 family protein [Allobranchiibius sp. CTAmp26]